MSSFRHRLRPEAECMLPVGWPAVGTAHRAICTRAEGCAGSRGPSSQVPAGAERTAGRAARAQTPASAPPHPASSTPSVGSPLSSKQAGQVAEDPSLRRWGSSACSSMTAGGRGRQDRPEIAASWFPCKTIQQ